MAPETGLKTTYETHVQTRYALAKYRLVTK